MKRYIKPTTEEMSADMQSLLSNSITNVDGVDIKVSDEDFAGGTADSRRNDKIWDDEELY